MVGYASALAVLGSFCMTTLMPLHPCGRQQPTLRGYGMMVHLYPAFVLHSILLPINLFKLARLQLFAGVDAQADSTGA